MAETTAVPPAGTLWLAGWLVITGAACTVKAALELSTDPQRLVIRTV